MTYLYSPESRMLDGQGYRKASFRSDRQRDNFDAWGYPVRSQALKFWVLTELKLLLNLI